MMRRFSLLTLLFVFILVGIAPRSMETAPPEKVSFTTPEGIVLRNIASDQTDPNHTDDGEPSIAVNPTNANQIAVVTFSETWNWNRRQPEAPVWLTSDGGKTWEKKWWLVEPKQGYAGPQDQMIAFTENGILMAVTMATPRGARRCGFFQWQANTGSPLSKVSPPFGTGATMFDQPGLLLLKGKQLHTLSSWLDIVRDSKTGKERAGIVNLTRFDPAKPNPLSEAKVASSKHRTIRLAKGADGKLYLFYKERGETDKDDPRFERCHFRVHRSDTDGATWDGLKQAEGFSTPNGTDQVTTFFTNSFGIRAAPITPSRLTSRCASSDGWIATHPKDKDRVYAVYVHWDKGQGKAALYLASSNNQARTWKVERVTDGSEHSAFPALAVSEEGTIGIKYVDYKDTGTKTIFRHWFARRSDQAKVWDHFLLQELDPSTLTFYSEPLILPQTRNVVFKEGFQLFWGDYEAITAVGNTFYGAFTGVSLGRSPPQLDPIFFSVPPEVKKK